jgi:hypothetical protein
MPGVGRRGAALETAASSLMEAAHAGRRGVGEVSWWQLEGY